MPLYSKQKIFCNACGKEFEKEYPLIIGLKFKVCSHECVKEMEWRHALSIVGEEYKERNFN